MISSTHTQPSPNHFEEYQKLNKNRQESVRTKLAIFVYKDIMLTCNCIMRTRHIFVRSDPMLL